MNGDHFILTFCESQASSTVTDTTFLHVKIFIFKLMFTFTGYFLDPVICQNSFPYAGSWLLKLPKGSLQTPDHNRATTAGKFYTHTCTHTHTHRGWKGSS